MAWDGYGKTATPDSNGRLVRPAQKSDMQLSLTSSKFKGMQVQGIHGDVFRFRLTSEPWEGVAEGERRK